MLIPFSVKIKRKLEQNIMFYFWKIARGSINMLDIAI